MGDAIKEPRAARGGGAAEDDEVETIFADAAVSIDCGETIRCLLYVQDADGLRRPLKWVVLPRSGYMISLVDAADRFLCGKPGSGLAAITVASLMMH